MDYLVAWEINISEDSPQAAAKYALDIIERKASLIFTVTDEQGNVSMVNLTPGEENDE